MTASETRRLLFGILFIISRTKRKTALVEGVGSLGGEAGLVLAAQHPVRQREPDLGVLQVKRSHDQTKRQTSPIIIACRQLHDRQV